MIFGIHTRCQYMKVMVIFRKFECRYDIHYKTQTRTNCEKCNSKAFSLGIESASSMLLDQCSTTDLPWSCIFRNWSRFGSYNVYLNDTRIP